MGTIHVSSCVVACVLAPRGLPMFRSKRPGLQLLRSCFMLGANACFFLAIRTMALVEATAIVFCGPLFVTLLSIPLLGERVGLRRISAVVVGFVGALIIIRPGRTFYRPWPFAVSGAVVCLISNPDPQAGAV